MFWKSAFLQRGSIDALTVYSPLVRGMPHVSGVEGEVAAASYGSVVAGTAGLAEYLERRHFSSRVSQGPARSLAEFATSMPSLAEAYRQVSSLTEDELAATRLATTVAFTLENWAPVVVPRNLVSLGELCDGREDRVNPVRDSSGMAAHSLPAEALRAATCEFLERQTWIAFWLGGAKAERIEMRPDRDVLPSCASALARSGDLQCFRLDAGYAVHVIAAFHRSKDGLACGLAAAAHPVEALRKATAEADHARQFFAGYHGASPSSLDRMLRNALEFRGSNPMRSVPDISCTERAYGNFCGLPVFSFESTKASLLSVTSEVFVYFGHEWSNLGDLTFAKVFSPAHYLHADPGVKLNFVNAFSRHLGISSPDPSRCTSTCMP